MRRLMILLGGLVAGGAMAAPAMAQSTSCPVTYDQLKTALTNADAADTSGFNNHFWGVVVDRQGIVCAVAFSGQSVPAQWLGSRQIAAAKAFTANAFSLAKGVGGTSALSTAQLYQFVQPSNPSVGNPLFGLDGGNVLDADAAYAGAYSAFGSTQDPMIGKRVGGTITSGGGLPLYSGPFVVGGLGLSGDTACADHSTAWRTRIALGLQESPAVDQLTFASNTQMTNGHPHCPNDGATQGSNTAPVAGAMGAMH